MLTVSEAMQRARVNGVTIRRSNTASTDWMVYLQEIPLDQQDVYTTDDLEDAVLMGGRMRACETRSKTLLKARKYN